MYEYSSNDSHVYIPKICSTILSTLITSTPSIPNSSLSDSLLQNVLLTFVSISLAKSSLVEFSKAGYRSDQGLIYTYGVRIYKASGQQSSRMAADNGTLPLIRSPHILYDFLCQPPQPWPWDITRGGVGVGGGGERALMVGDWLGEWKRGECSVRSMNWWYFVS